MDVPPQEVLEASFDDPIYMSINTALDDGPVQANVKKTRSIYDDLSDLLDDPPRPKGVERSKKPYPPQRAVSEPERDSMNVIEIGVGSDSSSEEEEVVAGPRVVNQVPSVSSLDKSSVFVLKWKGESSTSIPSGEYYRIQEDIAVSPDFEQKVIPAQILGKDGYGPVTVNNPFLPQSNALLPAKNRQELDDSLRNFADSLVRTANMQGDGPPMSPPLGSPILRPPMLPPLDPNASEEEKMRWHVLERLLMSESSVIISLTTAVDNYMKPLRDAIKDHNPILDAKNVLNLFGPVESVLEQQKLFYLAITQVALDWNKDSTIGNIFTSCFTRKPAIRAYSQFVCNFPVAMETMERMISKKPKFVTFLKQRLMADPTRLTLQGLLTKPIQRFPQYLLFLQDFMKYTPDKHPDKVSLQMALSHFEGIAEHLDEAKKEKYHDSFVKYLKLWGLPYKISDLKGQLIRKEEVVKFVFKGDQVIQKKRMLLLFNNKLVCAKEKEKNESSSSSSSIRESGEGSKFISRWVVNLYGVDVLEPDYEMKSGAPEHEEYETVCRLLRQEHQEIQHDIHTITQVITSLSALKKEYSNLDIKQFHNYLKALQIMMMKNKAMIRQYEGGRLDISIPLKEAGLGKVRRTYSFSSEAAKLRFVEELRHAKLRGKPENKPAWLVSRDHSDEDELLQPRSRKLPLFVQSVKCQLNFVSADMSTDCAVHTGLNRVWMASGVSSMSQIAVIECTTDSQRMTDCFPVEHRVLSMVFVPGNERKQDGEGTRDASTVWLGCQDGKLLMYNAASQKEKTCLSEVSLADSVTCLVYNMRKVFAGTAAGQVVVYKKNKLANSWDFEHPSVLQLKPGVVRCGCMVKPFLWLGNMNYICVINTASQKIQTYIKVGDDAAQSVKRIVPIGAGVWICLRRSLKILLLHKATHQLLQEINIAQGITPILQDVGVHQHIQIKGEMISSLLATPGYLWVGLSNGLIVIYRIPKLEGIPAIMSYPFLAQDSHEDSIRVMIYVNTSVSLEKEQLDKFIEDTSEDVGNLVVSTLESQVRDLTLHADRAMTEKTSTSRSFATRTLSNQESPDSKRSPFREVTAKSLIGRTLDHSYNDSEGEEDGEEGEKSFTGRTATSKQGETEPLLDEHQREDQPRKEINQAATPYKTHFSFTDYETLDKYRYAKPLIHDEITAEDLYAPVDPSELNMNYKAAREGEQSIHFVLTGARGLRNMSQVAKRGKGEDTMRLQDTTSCINIYEIPNLQ